MAAQERAGRRGCLEALSYSCPRCITMLADVVTGDLFRDTLVAKVQKQPIEQPRCVAPSDSGLDSAADPFENRQETSDPARPQTRVTSRMARPSLAASNARSEPRGAGAPARTLS